MDRAQAREAERVAALEAESGLFVEQLAVAWQDSREIEDKDVAQERQRLR